MCCGRKNLRKVGTGSPLEKTHVTEFATLGFKSRKGLYNEFFSPSHDSAPEELEKVIIESYNGLDLKES